VLKITTKAWLMPIYHDVKEGNWDVAGVAFPYPPTKWPEWSHRQSAIGAVIRPGQDLNLIFGMTRTWARSVCVLITTFIRANRHLVARLHARIGGRHRAHWPGPL
jgi:hypothetical protein